MLVVCFRMNDGQTFKRRLSVDKSNDDDIDVSDDIIDPPKKLRKDTDDDRGILEPLDAINIASAAAATKLCVKGLAEDDKTEMIRQWVAVSSACSASTSASPASTPASILEHEDIWRDSPTEDKPGGRSDSYATAILSLGTELSKVVIVANLCNRDYTIETVKYVYTTRRDPENNFYYKVEEETGDVAIPSAEEIDCKWLNFEGLCKEDKSTWKKFEAVIRSSTCLKLDKNSGQWIIEGTPHEESKSQIEDTRLKWLGESVKAAFLSDMRTARGRRCMEDIMDQCVLMIQLGDNTRVERGGTHPCDLFGFKYCIQSNYPTVQKNRSNPLTASVSSSETDDVACVDSVGITKGFADDFFEKHPGDKVLVHSDLCLLTFLSFQIWPLLIIEIKSGMCSQEKHHIQMKTQLIGALYKQTEVFGLLIYANSAYIYRAKKTPSDKVIQYWVKKYTFTTVTIDSNKELQKVFDSSKFLNFIKSLMVTIAYSYSEIEKTE